MILGISGKMRTGKNTVADFLCQRYGFRQAAFADVLKELGMRYFGLSREECYGEKTIRSRDVLQKIGVAWREIDEDVWCRYVLKNIPEHQHAVISDVRFPNEAQMIKDYGGKIIRVERVVEEQFGTQHISETALDDYQQFDVTIRNDESLEHLYQVLDDVMRGWGFGQ